MATRSEETLIAEERHRISREIHRGPAQNLAAIHMRMSVWRELVGDDPERINAEIDGLKSLLGDSIRQLKQLIFILRAIPLDELGFYPALNTFVTDLAEQSQLAVDLRIAGKERDLPEPLQHLLLRATQEILHSLVKQGQARSVHVELDTENPESVTLKLWDDRPFTNSVQFSHSELRRLMERIEELDGSMSIDSHAQQGTEFAIILPLSRFREE